MKNSFLCILIASIYLMSGCVAIPAGKVWHEDRENINIVFDDYPLETTLKIINSGDNGKVQVKVEELVERKETLEVREWAEKQKKVVVGLFPEQGSVKYSNIHDASTFDVPIPVILIVNSIMLMLPTVFSWFSEFRRDWEPTKHKEAMFSLFGWAKTADTIPTVEKYRKISSSKYNVTEPVSNQAVTFEIPETGFQTTRKTDNSGIMTLNLRDLPVIAENDVQLEISSPDTKPKPNPVRITLDHTVIGSAFANKLFAAGMSPDKIYSDNRKVSGGTQTPSAAPRADVTMKIIPQNRSRRDKIGLKLTVHNTGRGELYQFTARTRSKTKFLDKHTVFIGKIEPGEKVERIIYAEVPQSLKTGTYRVNTEFYEANNYEPSPIPLMVAVNALQRPVLAFTYKIIDDPESGKKIVGNGDGVIQKGEAFDLAVTIRNTGDRTAKDAAIEITMTDDKSVTLFSDTRLDLGKIEPGETIDTRFNIALRQRSELNSIPVHLLVKEQSFNAILYFAL